MHVGVDFPGIELVGQETRAGEHEPQSLPDFAVELVDIFKVLLEIFPERLVDVEGILSAAMAVHSFQFGTAVLTIGVCGYGFFADSLEAFQFDEPHDPAFSFFSSCRIQARKPIFCCVLCVVFSMSVKMNNQWYFDTKVRWGNEFCKYL